MPRRLITKLRKKAELALVHDPAARREARADGLEVGRLVRYDYEGTGRFGTVAAIHAKSVLVKKTAAGMMKNGEKLIVREDEIPFTAIREVLGEGYLPERSFAPSSKKLPAPPERAGGYQFCDIGNCSARPVKVYMVRKVTWDETRENGVSGPGRLVAVCKEHDERYEESHGEGKNFQPAHFPVLWSLGVVFDEYWIPKEETPGPTGSSDEEDDYE